MDESADGQRKKVFVVGGFIGTKEHWVDVEGAWESRVKRDGLDYFRTSDCIKLTKEFEKWVSRYGKKEARRMANELFDDLKILLKSTELQFACLVVPMADYAEIAAEPEGRRVLDPDPYFSAYGELVYRIARIVGDSPDRDMVAYLFDEHSKAERLSARWSDFKHRHPRAAAHMATIAPLDDKVSPCIQIADLIAHNTRETFEDQMDRNDENMASLEEWKPMVLWLARWDKVYLREMVSTSIAVAEGRAHISERDWDHRLLEERR